MTQPISYAPPPLNRRPTGLLVIGILGIVYAAGGLLSGLGTIMSLALQMSGGPFAQTVPGWVETLSIVLGLGSLLLSILLLLGSIQSIRYTPRCRSTLLTWAWLYLGWTLVTLALQVLLILPAMQQSMNATFAAAMAMPTTMTAGSVNISTTSFSVPPTPTPAPVPPATLPASTVAMMQSSMSWVMLAGVIMSALFSLIMPIATLIVVRISRRAIVAE